jgi:hypothetical protein
MGTGRPNKVFLRFHFWLQRKMHAPVLLRVQNLFFISHTCMKLNLLFLPSTPVRQGQRACNRLGFRDK